MSSNAAYFSRESNEQPASSIGSRCSARIDASKQKQKTAKVHSSFRISPLVEMFGNLSTAKENLLRSMNFHGLLQLPKDETETDRSFKLQFSLWLAVKVDPPTGDIDLGHRGRIPVSPEDVSFVLGLQCKGDEVVDHDPSQLERNKTIIKKNLLLADTDDIDLETIKKVLCRDISNDPDDPSSKAYMTAAVLYSVSYFLAPKGRPPKVNTEIFDSITNPNRIMKINWASYVLKVLKESSAKVKADLIAGKSSVCLDGCLLLLQIVYLDNIRFPSGTTQQYKAPRVSDFTFARLKRLIKMDKRSTDKENGEPYGCFELRHEAESFYTRGDRFREMLNSMNNENPSSSSNYDLEKLIEYIDQENTEHKRSIRKATIEFGDHLCLLSDRNSEDMKSMIHRWVTARIGTEQSVGKDKAPKESLKTFYINPFRNDKHSGYEKDKTTDGKRHAGVKQYAQNTEHIEVVDLTDNDESADCDTSRQSNNPEGADGTINIGIGHGNDMNCGPSTVVLPPERHGTKRAANRMPYSQWKDTQDSLVCQCANCACDSDGTEELNGSKNELGNGEGMDHLAKNAFAKPRTGRTKTMAVRRRIDKKQKLPQVDEAAEESKTE